MSEDERSKRATVHDVARQAGVSLATVDRVLNARPGVRAATAEKVAEAIRVLDFRRDLSASLLARARDLRVTFIIPDGGNEFMVHLGEVIARRARASRPERLGIRLQHIPPLDAAALAAALDALQPRSCDCALIVATEDPRVVKAVDAAARRANRRVVTFLDQAGPFSAPPGYWSMPEPDEDEDYAAGEGSHRWSYDEPPW